jgi:hypothetical protein
MSTSGRVGRWLREFTGRDGPLPDPLVRAAKQAPDRPLVGTRPLEADGMPIPGVGPQRTQLRAALVTIRPLQWIKNVLMIAAGLAVIVLIVSPGVAVAAMVGIGPVRASSRTRIQG